jgi:cytochrome c oxidase subunit 3
MKSLTTARGNPYVTMLWLSVLGSCLIFLFLILLFFVRTKSSGWEKIGVPAAFDFSTVCILFSSVSLHFSRTSFKRESFRTGFYWLSLTLILALAFGLLQYAGIRQINSEKRPLSDTAMAFTYLFSGLHFLHIVLGAGALAWVWGTFLRNLNYVDAFIVNLNPMTGTVFRTATIFWHFLGILWLLLFLVLLGNQP